MKTLIPILLFLVSAISSRAATYANIYTSNAFPAQVAITNKATLSGATVSKSLFLAQGKIVFTNQIEVADGQNITGMGMGTSVLESYLLDGQSKAITFLGNNTISGITLNIGTNGTGTMWLDGYIGATNITFQDCLINATFDLLHPVQAFGPGWTFDGCLITSMFDRFLGVANDTNSSLTIKNTTVQYDPRGRTYSPDDGNQADQCYWFTWIENSRFEFASSTTNGPTGGVPVYGFFHANNGGSLYMKDVFFDFQRITNVGATYITPPGLYNMAITNGAQVYMESVGWREPSGLTFTFSSPEFYSLNAATGTVRTLYVTNGLLLSTNYLAANFSPVQGYIKFATSNNALYSVSVSKTNLIGDP